MDLENRYPAPDNASEHGSQLFTVRVWQETTGLADAEWRGRLQHVLSGRVSYFRDWGALVTNLVAMLAGTGSEGSQRAIASVEQGPPVSEEAGKGEER